MAGVARGGRAAIAFGIVAVAVGVGMAVTPLEGKTRLNTSYSFSDPSVVSEPFDVEVMLDTESGSLTTEGDQTAARPGMEWPAEWFPPIDEEGEGERHAGHTVTVESVVTDATIESVDASDPAFRGTGFIPELVRDGDQTVVVVRCSDGKRWARVVREFYGPDLVPGSSAIIYLQPRSKNVRVSGPNGEVAITWRRGSWRRGLADGRFQMPEAGVYRLELASGEGRPGLSADLVVHSPGLTTYPWTRARRGGDPARALGSAALWVVLGAVAIAGGAIGTRRGRTPRWAWVALVGAGASVHVLRGSGLPGSYWYWRQPGLAAVCGISLAFVLSGAFALGRTSPRPAQPGAWRRIVGSIVLVPGIAAGVVAIWLAAWVMSPSEGYSDALGDAIGYTIHFLTYVFATLALFPAGWLLGRSTAPAPAAA